MGLMEVIAIANALVKTGTEIYDAIAANNGNMTEDQIEDLFATANVRRMEAELKLAKAVEEARKRRGRRA